ncbi:MAG: AI-2E family transporter [Verrucomicrobiaceae bacterium]|nr:MAG: AI-2E family transporter [Verrucomicrobiaceae bacterium]
MPGKPEIRMAIPVKRPTPAESLATISNVILSTFIVLALYFGRVLLVPLALAALLTFMLAPLVTLHQRWIGRIGAVLLVVMMMFAATGGVGWVLTRQAIDLADQLPGYKENIQVKLRSFQIPSKGPFSKISETFEDLKKDLPGGALSGTDSNRRPATKAMPVKIVDGKDQRLEFMQVVLTPVFGPLGTAGLVLILLIFMLLQREELRNRLIRLIGQGRMSTTARAMDDAGARVSKYLLMQLVVNVTYGIALAIGLYFIGVPNAILWGALAAVLRFIPYLGPWIAAAFPILLSLASSPGWMIPLMTLALFIVLELVSNNVMEPWLYGSSTGVTPIALIVAALVWTWLWGPVGLVLATPLTVCLVVMGRHIPKLAFLSIVLSDDEALNPAEDCYQRLLRTGEQDEMELVDGYLKTNPMHALFDSVLVPVVAAAGTDHRLGFIDDGQLESVESALSDIVDAVSPEFATTDDGLTNVCCVPARARRDQLAGEMLVRLLWQEGVSAQCAVAKTPLSELVAWVRKAKADVVCISVVVPSTLIHARYLCAKFRAIFPVMKIVVGLWGRPKLSPENVTTLRDSGADEIVASLAEALDHLVPRKPAEIPAPAEELIDPFQHSGITPMPGGLP